MFLYSAYLAEELHKPGGFTIAPLCGTIAPNIGSRPDGRCTFLEVNCSSTRLSLFLAVFSLEQCHLQRRLTPTPD